MDLDDELPRIHRNGATGMNQEPCGSETRWLPVPVTERLDGTRDSAEQAVHTPNDDEERLEQMSHPKNQGDGTEDAPRKVEWTCLGLYGMAMERSCSLWRRREFWDHSVPPNTTRSTRLSLCGCDLTTSISSPRTSHVCESAQTDDLRRQPSKKYSTEADVSHNRHVLEDSSGDGSRRPGE